MNSIENLYCCLTDELQNCSIFDAEVNVDAKTKTTVPLVVFHITGIYVFFDIDSLDERAYIRSLTNRLYPVQKAIGLPAHNFVMIGCYEDEEPVWVSVDPRNNLSRDIKNIEEFLSESFEDKMPVFDEATLNALYCKYNFSTVSDDNIKFDRNGDAYIKKGKKWFKASTEDPDSLFMVTLLGGWFGLHKFKQGSKLKGFLYMFTAGLFGFGWLFDLLELLLGVKKDSDGQLYLPLDNLNMKWLMFFGAVVMAGVFIFAYLKILVFVISAVSSLTGGIAQELPIEDLIQASEGF